MQFKNLWWHEYRKNQYKYKVRLNLEMIVRKSLAQAIKEYRDNCSIAGVKEMCDPRIGWKLRLVWIAIFLTMLITLCYILYCTWTDTLTMPLIVTMEDSTYPISMIDFPAVALCNVNRISKKRLREYAKSVYPKLALRNESLMEVEDYCSQSGRLLDFSYDESLHYHRFHDLIANKYDSHHIISHMKEMAPSCDEMLLKCIWAGEQVDCMSIFAVRRTVRGHCCAFNYILDYDSAGKPNRTIGEVKKQSVPGLFNGLIVVLDPMLEDYAYPLNSIKGFDVLLFDPTHFADPSGGRVIHRTAEPRNMAFLELESVKQVASPEVRKYPISSRQCLFHDEEPEKFGNMYSYSACIARCRIKSVQSLCKCTPYFLPTDIKTPVCTLEDLKCLNKYKEKLHYLYPMNSMDTQGLESELQNSLYCPDCLPDCELTKHITKSFRIPIAKEEISKKTFKEGFINTDGINLTDKCVLCIYQSSADGTLDRLDAVAYWFEILSNVGGFGGILIGFSIISAVEMFYFLFIRVLILIYFNFKKYYY